MKSAIRWAGRLLVYELDTWLMHFDKQIAPYTEFKRLQMENAQLKSHLSQAAARANSFERELHRLVEEKRNTETGNQQDQHQIAGAPPDPV